MDNEEKKEKTLMETVSETPVVYELDYTRLGLFMFAIFLVGGLFYALLQTSPSPQIVNAVIVEEVAKEKVGPDPFDEISLEGTAAFVWDVKKGEMLFGKNEEVQLPLASITKLMTVAAISGYIDFDETLIIENKSLNEEGDSGLLSFEEWNAKDLIDFTLIVSSNDGADVLANAAGASQLVRGDVVASSSHEAFITHMNDVAKTLGLSQTYFLNETGLDPTTIVSGGYGSARDTAILLEHLLKTNPELIEATTKQTHTFVSESNFVHTATNTNDIVGDIPGLIASKTGFTDLAGGNLIVAFDAGLDRPIIISVLGSSKEGRFTDVKKLVDASLQGIAR